MSLPYVVEGTVEPPIGLPRDFLADLKPHLLKFYNFPLSETAQIRQAALNDGYPMPDPVNREGYNRELHFKYWLFGYSDYLKIRKAMQEYNVPPGRLLDFGGSTGRVFRHFLTQGGVAEVWASDMKTVSVEWNRRHFGADVKAFLNTIQPSLPFEQNFFDVITAFSVFTHIDELEETWLMELRRILKPGGLLYLTNMDEASWRNMPANLRERIQGAAEQKGVDPESAEMAFDKECFVTKGHVHYSYNVFRSKRFVATHWGKIVRILGMIDDHHSFHTVVLATKPA